MCSRVNVKGGEELGSPADRLDRTERPMGEKKKSHPFSVESIMSGSTTRHAQHRDAGREGGKQGDGDGDGDGDGATVQSSASRYRDSYGPAEVHRKHVVSVPTSPVKSETSESDDGAPWIINGTFSSHSSK